MSTSDANPIIVVLLFLLRCLVPLLLMLGLSYLLRRFGLISDPEGAAPSERPENGQGGEAQEGAHSNGRG